MKNVSLTEAEVSLLKALLIKARDETEEYLIDLHKLKRNDAKAEEMARLISILQDKLY